MDFVLHFPADGWFSQKSRALSLESVFQSCVPLYDVEKLPLSGSASSLLNFDKNTHSCEIGWKNAMHQCV
jgi:hypothetical protein